MKPKVQTTHTQRTGRFVAFAAIIGLGLGAMFASTASAIMLDTDPVIEVDGSCNLFGPGSPSGIWISITNNDSWDEDYVIGVFEGIPEDDDMPTEIVEVTVASEETEQGPIFIDTVAATVQVIDLSEYDMGMVYDEFVLVCFPDIPDFDFDEDEDEDGSDEDDGVEEVDEGGEPVIVEDGSDEDDGAEAIDEGDELIICLDCEDDEVEEVDEGDAPVIVEDGSDEDEKVDEGDAPVIVEDDDVEVADEGYHAELALLVPAGDDEGEKADEDGTPVSIWENTTNDNSLDTDEGDNVGQPPEPKINPEDTDEGDNIGVPPEPKINPEDTDDTDDTDEAASSEGKETQGSSGLSLLWIILIIVAGLVTVGTATRKLQKNNS